MSTSPIPRLIDALRTAATQLLPDVHVSDSYSTENPERMVSLSIGVDDPDKATQTQTAIADMEWATQGMRLDVRQSGSVVSHMHAESGTVDAALVRNAVYGALDVLRELIRTREHAGVRLDVPGSWKVWLSQERLYQAQYESGAAADLIITISFEATV